MQTSYAVIERNVLRGFVLYCIKRFISYSTEIALVYDMYYLKKEVILACETTNQNYCPISTTLFLKTDLNYIIQV